MSPALYLVARVLAARSAAHRLLRRDRLFLRQLGLLPVQADGKKNVAHLGHHPVSRWGNAKGRDAAFGTGSREVLWQLHRALLEQVPIVRRSGIQPRFDLDSKDPDSPIPVITQRAGTNVAPTRPR